jgi:redox-sensing transcriptional repressor
MDENIVPDVVISRLPWYLQTLKQIADEGMQTVSSSLLAEKLGSTATQIRRDLSYFGGFGKQGRGYTINNLIEELENILNMDRIWPMIIVGAGDLGRALARYQGFQNQGLKVAMLFDNAPDVVDTLVGKLRVKHVDSMREEVKSNRIKIAIITVPANSAQEIADLLVEAGIQAILNYAPVTLVVQSSVRVQHIDPTLHLQRMLYYLDEN